MRTVKISPSMILVGNESYRKPLIKITLSEDKKETDWYKKISERGVVCIEYRVFSIDADYFIDEAFGSKVEENRSPDRLLFSVGGVWNNRRDVWLFEPEVRNREFWK